MSEHYTRESEGKVGTITTAEEARKAHHLATADPEPERDGVMRGFEHEAKYGLERADASRANWEQAHDRAVVGELSDDGRHAAEESK